MIKTHDELLDWMFEMEIDNEEIYSLAYRPNPEDYPILAYISANQVKFISIADKTQILQLVESTAFMEA